MVKIGQAVQKIWKKIYLGVVLRYLGAILFPGAILFHGQVYRKRLAGNFSAKIVKIGQAVEKIWQEEIFRSSILVYNEILEDLKLFSYSYDTGAFHCGIQFLYYWYKL